jgi:hypothetical protein
MSASKLTWGGESSQTALLGSGEWAGDMNGDDGLAYL